MQMTFPSIMFLLVECWAVSQSTALKSFLTQYIQCERIERIERQKGTTGRLLDHLKPYNYAKLI